MREALWYLLPPMPPSKRTRRQKKRRLTRRSTIVETKPTNPSPAETALLALARTLTAETGGDLAPRAAVMKLLDVLAHAFQAGARLPRALARARTARTDEARALAMAWAREQLRLSVGEILARAADAGELSVALPAESVAWLVLAACEALADEPPQAAPDRLRLLADWLTGEREAHGRASP